MKKLLGLMAIAPMGLAACGGSDAPLYGDATNDDYQKMVLEATLAGRGMGSKDDCGHFVAAEVGSCESDYETYKNGDGSAFEYTLTFTDWETQPEVNGLIEVDVTLKEEVKYTGEGDSGEDLSPVTTDVTFSFGKENDEWKITGYALQA